MELGLGLFSAWPRAGARGPGPGVVAAKAWGCLLRLLACASLLFGALQTHAAGTAAGTLIRNSVTIGFTYAGVPNTQQGVAVPIKVAQVLAPRVTWQDATPTPSNSPDSLRVLTFALTNTGNGSDTFVLSRDNAVAGDQFDPLDSPQGGIWLESGAQPGLQVSGPNADVAYVAGLNDVVLAQDASRTVYVVSSIPAGQVTGALGKVNLQARSTRAPANAMAGQSVGVDPSGVTLVAGPGGGRSVASGTYLVSVIAVAISKTVVSTVDAQGGSRVMPGATLTYRLTVSASGTGSASNLVVTDPLPTTLTYVPGSITVDGVARTDAVDADDSSFSAGTVRTVLPTIAAPQSRVIEFKATIN